jgi:hypothetical protein
LKTAPTFLLLTLSIQPDNFIPKMQNDTIGIPDGFSNCQNKFGILNFGHCDLFGIWHL